MWRVEDDVTVEIRVIKELEQDAVFSHVPRGLIAFDFFSPLLSTSSYQFSLPNASRVILTNLKHASEGESCQGNAISSYNLLS